MHRDLIAQFQREQLHRAARDGDLNLVNNLLTRGYPVNHFNDLGKTPLHYAVAGEHLHIVDALLRAGANINAHDERVIGDTPLAEYAGSCSLAMAQCLINAAADPTIPGWMMLTALDRAKDRQKTEGRAVFNLLEQTAFPQPTEIARFIFPPSHLVSESSVEIFSPAMTRN